MFKNEGIGEVVNLISSFINSYKVNEKDRILQLSSVSFDVSVNEIFVMLSVGGAIILPSFSQNENLNIQYFVALIQDFDITIMGAVPVLYPLPFNMRDLISENYH